MWLWMKLTSLNPGVGIIGKKEVWKGTEGSIQQTAACQASVLPRGAAGVTHLLNVQWASCFTQEDPEC